MDKSKQLLITIVRSVKSLADKVSLDELSLVVTDTVLGWTMEDLVSSMNQDYQSCVNIAAKLTDTTLSVTDRDHLQDVKSIYTRNCFHNYQAYCTFAKLNSQRGNVVTPVEINQNIIEMLCRDNYIFVLPKNTSEDVAVKEKKI